MAVSSDLVILLISNPKVIPQKSHKIQKGILEPKKIVNIPNFLIDFTFILHLLNIRIHRLLMIIRR